MQYKVFEQGVSGNYQESNEGWLASKEILFRGWAQKFVPLLLAGA
jgi:hypothetical protein